MQQVSSILLGGNKTPQGTAKEQQGEGFSDMFSEMQKQYRDSPADMGAKSRAGSSLDDSADRGALAEKADMAQDTESTQSLQTPEDIDGGEDTVSPELAHGKAEDDETTSQSILDEEGDEQSDKPLIDGSMELIFAQIQLSQNWLDKSQGGVQLPPEGEILASLQSAAGSEISLVQLMSLLSASSEGATGDAEALNMSELKALLQANPELKDVMTKLMEAMTGGGSQTGSLQQAISNGDLHALAQLTDIPLKTLEKLDLTQLQQLTGQISGMTDSNKHQLQLMVQNSSTQIAQESSARNDTSQRAAGDFAVSKGDARAQPASYSSAVLPHEALATKPASPVNVSTASVTVQADTELDTGPLKTEQISAKSLSQDIKLLNPEAVTRGEKISLSDAALRLQQAELAVTDAELDASLERTGQLNQNQSAMTASHRSAVPQFQLSIRQAMDAQALQQNMIQKFAPLMKQQLMNMVSNGIGQAEIRLDPPELGQMMVRIQVNGDQTQVQFQAMQQQTRDMLEQALPRLREMLQSQGLELADSQVSEQGHSGTNQGDGEHSSEGQTAGAQMDENPADGQLSQTNQTKSSTSGIDYYA